MKTSTSFKKGQGGKPKGAQMKATKKAKEIILAAIDNMAPDFMGVMNELKETDKKTYVQVMVRLFDFVLPKTIQLEGPENSKGIPIVSWAQDDNSQPKV